MANRYFNDALYTLEKLPVKLWVNLTLAGASNPTVNRAKGVASVTRNAGGQLTFVFNDTYNKLLGVSMVGVSNGAPTVTNLVGPVQIVTDSTNAASKTLVVATVTNSAGTFSIAADGTSGAVVLFEFTFSNSSAV